ncbi:MAG: hypothetical protein IJT59_07775 [Desulfovibrionaceae bacterium]|nr:hypothetical protein [Desulfovibrionaceae bacterium]
MDRWLESAVTALIQNLHTDAQPKPKRPARKRTPGLKASVVSMSIDDLYALTQRKNIQ